MDVYTWIMLIGAALILLALYVKPPEKANQGLSAGFMLFLEILPRMILAFIFAGLMQVMAPRGLITNWMGQESTGRQRWGNESWARPVLQFPRPCRSAGPGIKSGVGVGPLVSYLTAWSLFGLQCVIMWEFPFLGLSVVAVRAPRAFSFQSSRNGFTVICESGFLWNSVSYNVRQSHHEKKEI